MNQLIKAEYTNGGVFLRFRDRIITSVNTALKATKWGERLYIRDCSFVAFCAVAERLINAIQNNESEVII